MKFIMLGIARSFACDKGWRAGAMPGKLRKATVLLFLSPKLEIRPPFSALKSQKQGCRKHTTLFCIEEVRG